MLGLFAGSAYAVMAIGFVFVNSVIDTYPMQQGAMTILYAYVFLYSYEQTGNLAAALAIVTVIAVASSLLISRVVFEPLLTRHFPSLAAGLGILIIVEEVMSQYFYDGQPVSFPANLKLEGDFEVLGANVSYNRLLVFAFAVVAAALLALFFRRTRPGMRMRAIADSPTGAQLSGVNLVWTIRIAFVVAGISAVLAGILLGIMQSTVSPSLGTELTIKGLAAALLGGGMSLLGAVLASVLIAVLESLTIGYLSSEFSAVIAYALIIAVLLVRPDGLFGRRREARA